MNWKLIFNLLGAIMLFIIQLALIDSLPAGHYISLSLVILVFIVVLFDLETAATWFVVNGFLLDLFSFRIFGFYVLLMVAILAVVYFLLNNVLTNRSLYVFLMLVTAAILIYDFSNQLMFSLPWQNFFSEELKKLLINFLLTAIVFYGVTILSHRLRPVFLIRSKR